MFVKWNLLISLLFIIVAFVDILVPILSYNRRECCLSKCSFVTVSLHFSLIPFIEIVYYKLAVSYVHCMPSSGQSTHYWEPLPKQLEVSHTADIQFARNQSPVESLCCSWCRASAQPPDTQLHSHFLALSASKAYLQHILEIRGLHLFFLNVQPKRRALTQS